MRMHAWIAVVLCSAQAIVAQHRHGPWMLPARLGGQDGYVSLRSPDELHWRPHGGAGQSITLPIAELQCGAAVGREVLIAGTDDDGHTALVRVALLHGSLSARREQTWPNLVLRDLVYDARHDDLFAIDEQRGEVYCMRSDELPARDALVRVATLPHPRGSARADAEKGGLLFDFAGVEQPRARLFRVDGGWATETLVVDDRATPLVCVFAAPSRGPLRVQLGMPGSLRVEAADGRVLDLGAGERGTHAYALPAGAGLDPSLDHRVVVTIDGEDVAGDWFAPRLQLGRTVAGSALEIHGFGVDAGTRPYPGSLTMLQGRASVRASPGALRVFTWWRIAPHGAPPPLEEQGGLTWLAPADGLVATLHVPEPGAPVWAALSALPEDPALAGQVLWAQSCFEGPDGETSGPSEISGVVLRPRPKDGTAIDPALRALVEKTRRAATTADDIAAAIARIRAGSTVPGTFFRRMR